MTKFVLIPERTGDCGVARDMFLEEVNKFISDKKIISISITVAPAPPYTHHTLTAGITYEE